ncbi:MAG: HAD hydrolase-like protein [Eubacteriales bacterium]|nr:HAD hydrolase-like protein [Eubacteriales bacterium]
MFNKFFPNEYITSVYTHDFSTYNAKAILFDIDNTLVLHDEEATWYAKIFIKALKDKGIKIGIVSNNTGKRVYDFSYEIGADIFIENANKPKKDGYINAINLLNKISVGNQGKQFFNVNNVIFVGDQIFTDIYGANKAGLYTILTKPVGKEKYFHIKLKRILEGPFKLLLGKPKGSRVRYK